MKTIREMFNCEKIGGKHDLIDALEVRERERDEIKQNRNDSVARKLWEEIRSLQSAAAAERERVKVVLRDRLATRITNLDGFIDFVYPPPKPETLPAGIYSVSAPSGGYYRFFPEPFTPTVGNAYRRLVYEDEVTGKAEPSAMEQSCCNKNADFKACDCPKAAQCDAIGPHHGDKCDGGRVQSPNAQFTQECGACGGSGEKKADPTLLTFEEWSRTNLDWFLIYAELKAALLKLGRVRE